MRAPLSVESVEGELWREPWIETLNGNLVKNLPTQMIEDWGEKPGDQWKDPSPVGKLMSLKVSCRLWKTSQPNDEKTGEENRTNDQSMKNHPTNEGDWGGKPKDHKV